MIPSPSARDHIMQALNKLLCPGNRYFALFAMVGLPLFNAIPCFAKDWRRLEDRQSSTIDVDVESVAADEGLRQVLTRELFVAARKNSGKRDYDETQMLLRVDCERREAALREITYYLDAQFQEKVTIPPPNLSFHRRFHGEGRKVFWSLVCAPSVEQSGVPNR